MNIICVPYGTEHQQAVKVGETLRVLVKTPNDGNTWTGTVAIKTALGAAATDTASLSAYTGEKVAGQSFDLSVDYDTSSVPLVAGTRCLAIAEIATGSRSLDLMTVFDVLPTV